MSRAIRSIKAQQEALDAAYRKKLAEINQARIANLERLMAQAMKNGNSDQAFVIMERIRVLQKELPNEPAKVEVDTKTAPEPKTPATIEEAVIGTWDYKYGSLKGTWCINKDSTMVSHDGIKGKWRISKKKLIVEVRDPDKRSIHYEFPFTSVTQTVAESSTLTVDDEKCASATISKRTPGTPPK